MLAALMLEEEKWSRDVEEGERGGSSSNRAAHVRQRDGRSERRVAIIIPVGERWKALAS